MRSRKCAPPLQRRLASVADYWPFRLSWKELLCRLCFGRGCFQKLALNHLGYWRRLCAIPGLPARASICEIVAGITKWFGTYLHEPPSAC